MANSSSSPGPGCNERTRHDMIAARARGKLDVDATRAFLHGSEQSWKKREAVCEILRKDRAFDKSDKHYVTRKELYLRALAKQIRIEELKTKHSWDMDDMSFVTLVLDEPMPIHLHSIAFEPVFFSLGSQELIAKYGALVRSRGILGCYLQTELGHGSAVTALETTATFSPERDEFEINSPTLTSSKWWVGALGRTSTHGVVQARLILPDGKDMGPHLFFVQLRDMGSHRPMPNIVMGDIGPKVMGGYPGTDNGYARFSQVRIPRWQMLSKFAQVTRDGKYVKPVHEKVSYGGMLYIRANMVSAAGCAISKAVTIAIRYATVRRQGVKGSDGLEYQIIDYPSLQHRLLPMLARAYVYILLGRSVRDSFSDMSKKLSKGDASTLSDMHAILSGLKTLTTTSSVSDVETARRALGGHGFSAFSGLGSLYSNNLPSATYEGDNFVLDQQVVRAALKAYRQISSSQKLTPFMDFLRLIRQRNPPEYLRVTSNWKDLAFSISLLEWRAAKNVEARAEDDARNEVDASSDRRVARAVTDAYVAKQVLGFIGATSQRFSATNTSILTSLFKLFILSIIETSLEDLFSLGILAYSESAGSRSPSRSLRLEISSLYNELLPEAIALSDAFGYSDWELDSAIGVYDGNVYEKLWERAQTEPLNQAEVTEGYEQSIKPLLRRGKSLAEKETRSKL